MSVKLTIAGRGGDVTVMMWLDRITPVKVGDLRDALRENLVKENNKKSFST